MKRNKKIFGIFVLFVALLFFSSAFLSGCAEMKPYTTYSLNGQVGKLNKKTSRLSQSNTYLVQKLHGMQVNVANQGVDISNLAQKLHDMQTNIANQGVDISNINSKLNDTYGKYEVESHNIDVLRKQFRDYRLIVNKELVELLNSANIKPAIKKNIPLKKHFVTVHLNVNDFIKGISAYKNKNYAAALLSFDRFIGKYPKSKNIPDALFYKAVSNFNLKKYPVSILEFHKFSEVYQKNVHVPMAIYLQGMGFLKLSDKADASILFQQVVSKYSGTTAAKLSAKELKKLTK